MHLSIETLSAEYARAPRIGGAVVTAAASLADRTEQSLLQQHAAFVAGLPCDDQAKRLRRAGAERLLARHPDLQGWMGRPTADRIAEARRLYAWPFLSWCFAIGAIRPDVELLAAKSKGLHYITWARMHPDQVASPPAPSRWAGWPSGSTGSRQRRWPRSA